MGQPADSRTVTSSRPWFSHRNGSRKLLPEAEFLDTISREKRRSERSGNSFLLALVHLVGPEWDSRDDQMTAAVTHAVCSVSRNTDIDGWYVAGTTLGVIFTELREGRMPAACDRIVAKLKQALCAVLPLDAACSIEITCHVYPETKGGAALSDPILYPEATASAGKSARILKRCMDIAGSLLALVMFSPLLLVIALAVKLTSAGPIWYRQTRVGTGGRPFTFLKFRSMFHNSDPSLHRAYVERMIAGDDVAHVHGGTTAGRVYKLVNDPRITPIGRVLRRSSLDELPQFVNVLKGEMSLVGPRPPLPYEVERYSSWHRRRVLEVPPGLTGLWQVRGRSRTNFDEMVRLDLQYASQWSLWLDLKILLTTPVAVIFGAGAH